MEKIDPTKTPASMPPPGVRPNFQSPNTQAHVFYAEGSTLLVLMLCFFAVRIYTKCRILRKLAWDDLTCSIATLGTVYFYVAVILCLTKAKFGLHIWDISLEHLESNDFLVPAYMIEAWSTIIFLFLKLTFMLLYLQIFRPNLWLRYGCYLGIGIMTLFYLGIWVARMYKASPKPGQSWQDHFNSPRYSKATNIAIPLTSVSLVFDLYIILLPIAGVMQLQMSLKRKLETSAMFVSGFAAVIASALSLFYRVKASKIDFTYTNFPVIVTAFTEMAVGVSVTCMPTTSVFIRKFRETHANTPDAAGSRRQFHPQATGSSAKPYRRWQEKLRVSFRAPSANKWRNLDDSSRDLRTHDSAALELGNCQDHTTTTVVGGGFHSHEYLGSEIHYSRSIHAESERG